MSISIKEIHVNNLGPISEPINWELSSLNLVYGRNETGKTYLVEFLIRSLFKTSDWKLRHALGNGNIVVEGLEDGPVRFTPTSSKKIEDIYHSDQGWIPPKFSKLLVVKAAELELDNDLDTDKLILKRYLSSKEILDTIEDRISKTLQKTDIDEYEIIGNNQGEIKTKNALETKLKKINGLFNDVNEQYLDGQLRFHQDQKKKIQHQLDEQIDAKKYHAYQLSQKIDTLRRKQKEFDDNRFDDLKTKVATFFSTEHKLKGTVMKYETKKQEGKYYPWVKEAEETYETHLDEKKPRSQINPIFPIVLFILI